MIRSAMCSASDCTPIGRDAAARSNAPTMPELMSAAEIADELGVSRQRVHKLREMATFPLPLAELRGGAVWDAVAVRTFAENWKRKPGRPSANAAAGGCSPEPG